MDSQDLFERGRKGLEELLNREVSATGDVRSYEIQCWVECMTEEARKIPSEEAVAMLLEGCVPEVRAVNFIYVRTDQEYFIGRGSHQAALDLGEGLVAKGSIHRGTTPIRKVMEKYPAILPFCCELYRFTKETVDQLGSVFTRTKIVVPKISLYDVGWNPEKDRIVVSPDVYNARYSDSVRLLTGEIKSQFPYPNVCITKDLREGGRFRVSDYDETIAKDLVNGAEITDQFDSAYALLMEYYEAYNCPHPDPGKSPYLRRKPHGPDFSPDKAIKNMFLLQVPVDKGAEGRLVVGDIDHVVLFK